MDLILAIILSVMFVFHLVCEWREPSHGDFWGKAITMSIVIIMSYAFAHAMVL